jgi:site-specific DNA recombinase
MANVGGADQSVGMAAIKAYIRECDRKLDRYRQALVAGTDPTIVAAGYPRSRKCGLGAQARPTEADLKATEVVSPSELRAQVEAIGGLLPLLDTSDTALKARFVS